MKIQPVDFNDVPEPPPTAVRLVFKSRFKRLFERPFSSPLKLSSPDFNKDGSEKFEPSSICLAKMVQNFIEGRDEKHQQRCGRSRCSCFNGNCTESTDEDADSYNSSLSQACDVLKSLVPCMSVSERSLLAHIAHIVEKSKINKLNDGICRKNVVDGLIALGYNASICRSKWEKSPSCHPGKHEYVDVITDGERLIIEVDFKSEFEIARSTKAYRLVLQTLPNVFVGKTHRLEKIIDIVSDAAKLSLKKKGMPFPPWRRADYVKAKWLSTFTRNDSIPLLARKSACGDNNNDNNGASIFSSSIKGVKKWEPLPLEFKPKIINKGVKVIKTGLASVIEDNPLDSSSLQILGR